MYIEFTSYLIMMKYLCVFQEIAFYVTVVSYGSRLYIMKLTACTLEITSKESLAIYSTT